MKSSTQYKVKRLLAHLSSGKQAEVYLRGDTRAWLVGSAELKDAHSLECEVVPARTVIFAPDDVVAVALLEG